MNSRARLLEAKGVTLAMPGREGRASFQLGPVNVVVGEGETVACVGRSGCGKSTLLRVLSGQAKADRGCVQARIESDLVDLYHEDARIRRQLRRRFGFVDQNPAASLNHRRRVIDIVEEPLVSAGPMTRADRRKRASEVLDKVGLGGRFHRSYPGVLSGGQQQRVAIARAVVARPQILFLDEPTTALDPETQVHVLSLLRSFRDEDRCAVLLVTHDLAVVRQLADRVIVFDNGLSVEAGAVAAVFDAPKSGVLSGLLAV